MDTVLIQSWRDERPNGWLGACLASARGLAAARGWRYHFAGDEPLFAALPAWFHAKAAGRGPLLADLGRLLLARRWLEAGAERVVWLDADVLVHDPDALVVPQGPPGYAFGREVWVAPDGRGRLRARRHVHNAVCLFEAGNPFLDFYIHACEAVLSRHAGDPAPQLLGPKFLSAQHSLLGFPLIEAVGMASPRVVADIAAGGGAALDMLLAVSGGGPAGLNLCTSLRGREVDGVVLDDALFEAAADRLIAHGLPCPSAGRRPI